MSSTIITKFAHLQIPLEVLVEATNNFHHDNIIGHGGLGTAYRGQLLRSGRLIKISALRVDRKQGEGDVEFWTEISLLSDLSHPNLVSIIGFCDEKHEKVIITTYAAKGSLKEHLDNPNLTWTQRLKICVGVARALSYLHHDEGRGYGVIHLNINSSSILLDENREPKLSGFKVSVKQSLNRMDRVILSEPIGSIGYVDPDIEKSKGVTPKSDIYSFGVVLFELLCGRRAYIKNETNRFLAPLAKYHYENKTLQDIIPPDLRNQMSSESLKIYSQMAYSCLEKDRAHRPHILVILSKLEKALELQLRHKNLEYNLAHLKIPLSDIQLASDNFSETYLIAYKDGHSLYRSEFDQFDKESSSSEIGENKGKHLKGHTSSVIIKRYTSGRDEYIEVEFYVEIEMLVSVKHPNIVTLLGFCVEGSEMILVIENISNGHLNDYLGKINDMRVLTWEKRLKICIDVAHAVNYLHYEMEDQKVIINRDIHSGNIGLDQNWMAKIVDFGHSIFLPPNQEDEALHIDSIGRPTYIDPEYEKTGKLKKESDVYSFGVVMFEILCGRFADDPIYLKEGGKGLAYVARRNFNTRTLEELIDPILKEETDFILNRGPNKDSLHTFIEIASQCVTETQDQRPTMKVIVKELEKALFFQKNNKDNPRISLEDIKASTQNFHHDNCIGGGGFGGVFKGIFQDGDGFRTIIAKRLDTRLGQGELQFFNELQILLEYKHENVIGLVGYCDEEDERIIVYEYTPNGSLDRRLKDASLSWVKRLNICIDVASALDFLHGGVGKQARVIHRDITTSNILLNHDWKAKLSDFGISLISPINQETDYVIDYACGTPGYMDPLYEKSRFLTIESDIYSFGVVLFEILCGRSTIEIHKHEGHHLPNFIKNRFEEGKHDAVVFEQIREQIIPKSLTTFQEIAYQCLHHERKKRPTTKKVLMQLKKALKFQTMSSTMTKFASLQIPLEDVVKATYNFHYDNITVHGGVSTTYKGVLLYSGTLMKIAAERFDCMHREADLMFLREISMLYDLKHKNLVSIIGFCDEEDEKIIVTTYEARGSLGQYLNNLNLTWTPRLNICLGVAHALSYLHFYEGRDYAIVHCNIHSDTILLNEKWEAKLSGFEFSIKQSLYNKDQVCYCEHIGTIGCMDPSIEKTGGVTHKSDIYSFGVVLFEMLCGRKAFIQNEAKSFLAPLAKYHYEKGTLQEIIHSDIQLNQMSPKSLLIYSKVAYSCLAEDRAHRPSMDYIVGELKKALELQLHHENITNRHDPLEIGLEEIVSATDNFSDENLIKKGEFANYYKGKMLRSGQLIDICARRLNATYGQCDIIWFRTEITMLSNLKHTNIISFLGFCDEYDEKILIYEHAFYGSLDQHLSDPDLTWSERLKICSGVARALSYIHYDFVHCDINSSKIFLDKDWEPKISGFELSTKYPQSWRHRLLSSHSFDNTNMTPKYDVYSFGVLLFEVFNMVKPVKTQRQGIINPKLREQLDRQSLTSLTNIIDNCLNEHPVQRPTMDQVVKELEEVLEFQSKQQSLEHLKAADKDEGTSSDLLKLEPLKISLKEIEVATNGFNEANFLAAGAFGSVYKGELDIQNSTSPEGEQPKIRTKTSVAIKCLKNKQDAVSKQGFLTEVELLTSCKHQNVISLLGLYMEDDDIMLVYEYASKGRLSDYLGSTHKNINLTWRKRLEICLDVARGINYLHTSMKGKPMIIHRDIKSENILLDENLNAKIADFGLSKFNLRSQQVNTIHTQHIVGTHFYLDPEYLASAKYKKESDVYSFGVVLFEMLSGRLAYESICTKEHDEGLAPIARRRFNEKTLKELIDPKMIDEDGDHVVTLNRGPNQESFEVFSGIAYQCLAETQAKRPAMDAVIKELENALNLQGETVVLSRFRLDDLLLATKNFSETCCIGLHEYGKVYKAELEDFDNKSLLAYKEKSDGEWPKTWPKTRINVAIKHISGSTDVRQRFFSEIERRISCKHPNMVDVLGFCDERDEIILVYEHASDKTLDYYLKNVDNMDNLTWTERLCMCLGIARGLDHLHSKMHSQERLIFGNITSANILFGKNQEMKVAYFGISKFHLANQEASTLISTQVYRDPEFEKTLVMKKESDVYSFGVILFEIFCGKLAYDPIYIDNNQKGLPDVARNHLNDGTIKKLLDHKIKEVTEDDTSKRGPNQDSLNTFLKIAYQCLEETQAERPPMEMVIKELEMALNFQKNSVK